ncbi:hypothetical protein LFM56_11310 [Cellulomonas iranensis]|uniref:DUF6636 domain-containing protein n=1 Tax=Cellulomonas iranensis TaxID=76862 RepID=UPI001CF585E3|nr:DUF6636 domain-containing protein [Cellulomonas iranensis]UCN13502.1 hypothetical protein LFM56_11310 [Cellulomonas iranensis]
MSGRGPFAGLSPAMKAFLLVDALLVVLLVVVLAVTLPGRGGGGRDDAGAADASASASPTPAAAADRPVTFALPSGNIECEMSTSGVVCTIGTFTYAPPQVTGCDAGAGHVVRLDADGFAFQCEDDGVPDLGTPVELAYGATQAVGGYTCSSGTDGVTCTDAAGVGFRLARAQWVTLP